MSDLSETLHVATFRSAHDRVVIRVAGVLDAAGAVLLTDEAARLAVRDGDVVMVDADGLTYLNSAGVGALHTVEAFVTAQGGIVTIASPDQRTRSILELAGLGRLVGADDGTPRSNGHHPSVSRHAGSTLALTRTDIADGATLAVSGEIDRASAPTLLTHVQRAIDSRPGVIVVDLGGVTFMDASGTHALAAARRCAGARVQLGQISAPVHRVLELTGLLETYAPAEGCSPTP